MTNDCVVRIDEPGLAGWTASVAGVGVQPFNHFGAFDAEDMTADV